MAAPTRPAVGGEVIIRRDNEQLPIGTVVYESNGNGTLTKVSETDWEHSVNGRTHNRSDLSARRIIASYPEPVADDRPEIGATVIICNDNHTLPIGTVLRSPVTGRNMTKISDQRWSNGDREFDYDTLDNHRVVHSYPPERPAIGSQVRIDRVNDQLPIGTVVHFADVAQDDLTTYVKMEDGRWRNRRDTDDAQGRTFSREAIIDSYPDAEPVVEPVVEPQFRLYTPDMIVTNEELDHLPTGAVVIDQSGRGNRHTRRDDGGWDHDNGGNIEHDILTGINRAVPGGIRVAALPLMTAELWRDAPVGSVFCSHEPVREGDVRNRRLHPTIKREDAWYCNDQVANRNNYTFMLYRLVWWGDSVETPAETPAETPTESPVETGEVPPFTRVTRALMDRMPVGSQIIRDGSDDTPYNRWQKDANGSWRRSSTTQLYSSASFRADRYVTVRWGSIEPQTPAAPAVRNGPQVGDRLGGRVAGSNMNALPVGTVIADFPDRRYFFTKLENQRWMRNSDSVTYPSRDFSATYVIESLPVITPPQVQAQLDAMRVRIMNCIDTCVTRQGGFTGDVRDGAWMKLGFSDLPARGTLPGRTAYGLPNNSIVVQNGQLFRVDDSRNWPERFNFDGERHTRDYVQDVTVEVIWVPTTESPVYYSDLDMLHKFWLVYSKMRPLHHWCSYVDDQLRLAGLADPGEQPQSFAQDEAVVEPETVIELGLLDSRELSRETQQRILAAFRAMPAGSVCHGDEVYIKTPESWVRAVDLGPAFNGAMTTFINVTIDYIPEARTVAQQFAEPF